MSIVELPTFSDKEIVTPEKLNALVDALNAKFVGGFDASDLQWPLEAEGDLAMGIYNITGARKIWNAINAANYATLQDAVTAAGTGGCVFIPPDTTVTASGVAIVGDGVAIIGAGPSSVIELTSAATAGYLLRSATTGIAGFMLANLTLSGNGHTGTGQQGLILRYVSDVFISNVIFDDFSGPALELTNSGSDGAACSRVYIHDCIFKDGSGSGSYHIKANDVSDLVIRGCHSTGGPDDFIRIVAGAANQLVRRIHVDGNVVSSGAGFAVYIAGNSGTSSDNWADVSVTNNTVRGRTGSDAGIVVGASSAKLRRVLVAHNNAAGSVGDGLVVNADYARVHDNHLRGAAGDGIDLLETDDGVIHSNDAADAGAYGIDAHSTTDCVAYDNKVQGASTAPIYFSATLRQWANGDTVGALPYTSYVNQGGTLADAGAATNGSTVTIPANTLRPGDTIRVVGVMSHSGSGDNVANARIEIQPTGGAAETLAALGSLNTTQIGYMDATMVVISATTAIAVGFGCANNAAAVPHVNYDVGIVINAATAMTISMYVDPYGTNQTTLRSLVVTRYGGAEDQT